jgi:serine/threonine-protein kinase
MPSFSRSAPLLGQTLGPFAITGLLGEGGMGAVFAARDASGKAVAVKVLHAELAADIDVVARFLREARAAGCISHPNVVEIPDAGLLADGRPYLVMPCLEGETLAARMARAPMSGAEVLGLVRQMMSGLGAAHGARVVHRDLKPHNVFLARGPDGQSQVKLLDFGLAKMEQDELEPMSRTRSLIGTPAYLAPEQARGRAAQPACDVYALGVMLFQLLVGRLPFEADNNADLIAAHLREAPPRARALRPELPATIDDLLDRMLAKEPADRATLDEVEQALGRSARALGTLSAPLVRDPRPVPLVRWSRRVIALALVALAAIVAAVVVVKNLGPPRTARAARSTTPPPRSTPRVELPARLAPRPPVVPVAAPPIPVAPVAPVPRSSAAVHKKASPPPRVDAGPGPGIGSSVATVPVEPVTPPVARPVVPTQPPRGDQLIDP